MHPEFPESAMWLNASPITLRALQGRPVVLAFVNASSVWSIQRLLELMRWQARRPGWLRLIIIHVPRFDFELLPELVLKRFRADGICAPILHDHDWQVWQRFAIQSWPTIVLYDAQGQEQTRFVGHDTALGEALLQLCAGQADPSPSARESFQEQHPEPRTSLCFPRGLVANSRHLYIADTGNHRVLECQLTGRITRCFGCGTADLIDGTADEASFNHPQGLALDGETLYVADTHNHAIRRISLLQGRVDTICGNQKIGVPREGPVNSPWDVQLNWPQGIATTRNRLLFSSGADNQIWSFDLNQSRMSCVAGSGALACQDAHGLRAAFAQPVALTAIREIAYVCDALSSSIRSLHLADQSVQTLVGGRGVWEFGDVDGSRSLARLQCPQGIVLDPGSPLLWVADTGNGQLRSLRLGGGDLTRMALSRPLQGPTALAVASGAVWIAETDAHAIARYDLTTGALDDIPIRE